MTPGSRGLFNLLFSLGYTEMEIARIVSSGESTYNQVHEIINEALHSITENEATVIRLRFGVGVNRAYTLDSIGQKLGLTRQRIAQIQAKALRKLRHPSRGRTLEAFLRNK